MRKNDVFSAAIGVALGTAIGLFAVTHREPMTVVATTLPVEEMQVVETVLEEQKIRQITEGERDVLAAITWAEAGNQDLDGKRLVVDTVLNRVDDPRFPNDIVGVIFQKHQYWTKGMPKSFEGLEECYEAVDLELAGKLNSEVLYFRTGNYHSFGTPVLQHGVHYFSK